MSSLVSKNVLDVAEIKRAQKMPGTLLLTDKMRRKYPISKL